MSNVNIDDSSVYKLFDSLNEDNRKDILLKALKKAAKELQEATKNNLRQRLGSKATSPNRWNGKTLESGIKTKADKAYTEVNVNIMGDFRLKFFEKGTKERYTNKGYYRGRMGSGESSKYLNFFKTARDQDYTNTITDSISQSLNKIKQ